MIDKDRNFFQYNSSSVYNFPAYKSIKNFIWKVAIKYVGPLVVYKIIDPHNCLLMTLDGKILRGLFKYEKVKASHNKN